MGLQTKLKRSKIVQAIRQKLPDNWRTEMGDIDRWWRYVFYQRFFRKKVLGLFPVFRYLPKILKEETRILGIWNFTTTPPTIGAFLEFEMRLLCMSYLNGNCKIDVVFIYDSERKRTLGEERYGSWMNPSNFHYHFGEMYPMVNLLPNLGSVFLFDSHDKFEKFYLDNQDKYIAHPAFFDYINNSTSRPCIPFVRDFYLKEKFLPKLEFKSATINWARAFIKKHVSDNYMVVVSLRHNSIYTPHRDSNLSEWAKFFKYCLDKYPEITFIVTGRVNEVKGHLADLPNVKYSQAENHNIEQDLALIELSLVYMATVFGPASLPILSSHIPFIITNYENPEKLYDYKWLKKDGHFPWNNTEIQKLVWEKENAEILISEFEKIYSKVDKDGWKNRLNLSNAEESALEWPYK